MPDVGQYLFATYPGEPDAFVWLAGVIFLLGLASGLFVYLRSDALFPVPIVRKVAQPAAVTSIVISGLGLLFTVFALLLVPLLGSRFWLAGLLLAGLIGLAYLVFYLIVRFPARLQSYQQGLLRQRYLPRPSDRRQPASKKKGGKRRK
jgi:hypothetical protein